jgi:hypothetical protein
MLLSVLLSVQVKLDKSTNKSTDEINRASVYERLSSIKFLPRFFPDYNLAFVLLKKRTEQSDKNNIASRPSEASIKTYERSEFRVFFAF